MDFEDEKLRYGGAQVANGEEDDAARKAEEREAKKAEVRKRLEEAGNKKNKKKGFLTPERKKKLRAAEGLKQQQLLKEQERQKALQSRIIPLPDVDAVDDTGKLTQIYEEMWNRVCALEAEKYDINYLVNTTEAEINELTIAVNDLRGKFVKPTLKKVSKYDNKFKRHGEEGGKTEKQDFRSNLKIVKKETNIDDIMAKTKKNDGKPDWSKKNADAPKKDDDAPAAEAAPADEPAAEEPEAEEAEEEEEEEE